MMVLALVSLAAACKSNPVGRLCFIGSSIDGGVPETIVASPALECQSRVCLHLAESQAMDLCTAECGSDDDCDTSPESPCKGGFACMIPVTVGSFCCKKLCVCKDYLTIPDGGVIDPAACDPTNATNECCNLTGRREDPSKYPACQL
jgi:hypothetical protein